MVKAEAPKARIVDTHLSQKEKGIATEVAIPFVFRRPKAFRVGTKSWSGYGRCSESGRLRVGWPRERNHVVFMGCRVSRTDTPK